MWGVLGIGLGRLHPFPVLVALVAWAYALWFGVFETLGIPLRSPGLAWQVPSHWVNGRPSVLQALVWGAILGPGLLTRNPYAGIWLLLPLVAFNHNLLMAAAVGGAVGVAHGGARVFGVLHNRRYMETSNGHLKILGSQLQWRYMDGVAMLLAAGALTAYTLSLLGVHL